MWRTKVATMSDMKCPFCGKKLTQSYFADQLCCEKCWENATERVWQALIQAKQDLAKAIDVIDTVRQHKRGTAVICPNDIAAYCDRAIERITHDHSEKAN